MNPRAKGASKSRQPSHRRCVQVPSILRTFPIEPGAAQRPFSCFFGAKPWELGNLSYVTYWRGATKDMTHAVIVTPDHGKIITSMISLNSATGHARPKELLRQIKNADEIIYISDNIQDGPSGYSRPPSGVRGSTLNTQLHPSGSSIIEDSRRGGKDVAGGDYGCLAMGPCLCRKA